MRSKTAAVPAISLALKREAAERGLSAAWRAASTYRRACESGVEPAGELAAGEEGLDLGLVFWGAARAEFCGEGVG